jgi:hypothetical protein
MREPLFIRLVKNCLGTTETPIQSAQVPPGEIWEFNCVTVFNGSAENFLIKIQVLNRDQAITYSLTAALATLQAALPAVNPLLAAGEILQVLATGSAAGGDITLLATGWRNRLEKSPAGG